MSFRLRSLLSFVSHRLRALVELNLSARKVGLSVEAGVPPARIRATQRDTPMLSGLQRLEHGAQIPAVFFQALPGSLVIAIH